MSIIDRIKRLLTGKSVSDRRFLLERCIASGRISATDHQSIAGFRFRNKGRFLLDGEPCCRAADCACDALELPGVVSGCSVWCPCCVELPSDE